MYWRSCFLSLFLVVWFQTQAQKVRISSEAQISVMTLGPYQEELYSAFGHTAIHLKDPQRDIDWVYNYGVFDFEQENFYLNFARGIMVYQLGMSRYEPFRDHYIRENRYIIEQQLNLNWAEKQKLVDFLAENYEPQNREYFYNYVYNNCSSKIPEILEKTFPDRITFDTSYVESGKTIRDLMHDYLHEQPWGEWIIDIGLGHQIDHPATAWEYMFLPDFVTKALNGATLMDSTSVPLVSKTLNVYEVKPEEKKPSVFTPFNCFVLFFFVVGFITNRDYKHDKRTKWIDPVVFTLAGFLGWWLVFLWLGTAHLSKDNFNLLWAIPLHIPFAYMLGMKKWQHALSKYFLYVSILYIVLLIFWSVLPQPLNQGLIPLILTMILRGLYIHHDLQKNLKVRKTTTR